MFGLSCDWVTAGLVACVVGVLGLLVYGQMRSSVPWNFWDTIRDDSTRRASLDKTITLALCVVAVWYVAAVSTDVTFDSTGKGGSTLLQVLSVFLVLRGAKTGIQAWKDKAPAAAQQGDNIAQQVLVADAAPTPGGKPPPAVKVPTK